MATPMCWRSRDPRIWPRSLGRLPSPAITSSFLALAISPNGRMRCRASLRRKPCAMLSLDKTRAFVFKDIVPKLRAQMPALRGSLTANAPLAPLSWFRTGGPAQVFFEPADESDLAYFLTKLGPGVPVLVVGAGSYILLR